MKTSVRAAVWVLAFLSPLLFSAESVAESRVYYLRVTFRSGERYETLSTFDPINYCHTNGGSVRYSRDHLMIYSPEMKVKVMRTWIDPRDNIALHWRDILRRNNMLSNHNHKSLPRVQRLTLMDMQQPE